MPEAMRAEYKLYVSVPVHPGNQHLRAVKKSLFFCFVFFVHRSRTPHNNLQPS